MVYKYSWSGPDRAVSAEKVGNHLRKLEEQNGTVTSEMFLESARSEDSEMHCLFEWNDPTAAEAFRLQQARVIIASLRVTVEEEEEEVEPVIVRAFVKTDEEQKGYINISKAMSDEDMRNSVLEDAKKELAWFVNKYNSLKELSGVFDAINKFMEDMA